MRKRSKQRLLGGLIPSFYRFLQKLNQSTPTKNFPSWRGCPVVEQRGVILLSQKSEKANRKEQLVRNLTNWSEKSTPSVRNLTNGEVALVRYLTKPKVIRFSVRYVGQGLQVTKFDLCRWGRCWTPIPLYLAAENSAVNLAAENSAVSF